MTGDADVAADIAQETFIRWVEREPANSEPRAWLFKVATNLCRDHGRVSSRRLTLLKESPEDTPVGRPPVDPHQSLELDERERAVREVLAAIPDRDRTMLLMQQEGFTHREIADAVETTEKSVGTMLARALRRFSAEFAVRAESLR
jgi:RNA polymerase sigma-70 factor (ECF subfamily)